MGDDSQPNGAPRQPQASETVPGLPEISYKLARRVKDFFEEQTDDPALRHVQEHAKVSMDVISEALQRYGLRQLSLSYNGGKDCLVLLVLILAALPDWASKSTQPADAPAVPSELLQAIYIVSREPFDEVEEFVAESAKEYHLELRRYELNMRPALEAYLADKPNVKAVFMGTRRTDPHCENLTHFKPTDKDWPQFMRINPVIDWHYADIWTFIRHLDIPFCPLYSLGFTSLGGRNDTHPNPALAVDSDSNNFRPAYELVRDDEERLGRDR